MKIVVGSTYWQDCQSILEGIQISQKLSNEFNQCFEIALIDSDNGAVLADVVVMPGRKFMVLHDTGMGCVRDFGSFMTRDESAIIQWRLLRNGYSIKEFYEITTD